MVRNMKLTSEEWKIANKLPFLTKIPTLYIQNVNYRDLAKDGKDGSNAYTRQLRYHMSIKESTANVMTMSLQIEKDMVETSNLTESDLDYYYDKEMGDSEGLGRKLVPESYNNYKETFGLAEYPSQMGDLIKYGCSIMKSKRIYSIHEQTASS